MEENLTVLEALRPPNPVGYKLRVVANPGIGARNLVGRAGKILHGRGRRLIWLRRGRRVVWLEWRADAPLLPFAEAADLLKPA